MQCPSVNIGENPRFKNTSKLIKFTQSLRRLSVRYNRVQRNRARSLTHPDCLDAAVRRGGEGLADYKTLWAGDGAANWSHDPKAGALLQTIHQTRVWRLHGRSQISALPSSHGLLTFLSSQPRSPPLDFPITPCLQSVPLKHLCWVSLDNPGLNKYGRLISIRMQFHLQPWPSCHVKLQFHTL